MDLPPVNGFDSILVVVDQGLTKGVILIPCDKMITAEGMAKLLLREYDGLQVRVGTGTDAGWQIALFTTGSMDFVVCLY